MRTRECRAARPPTHVRPIVSRSRGELDQIQFLLGHVSVQTTERYIGCRQRLRNAVNDSIGLEPEQPPEP